MNKNLNQLAQMQPFLFKRAQEMSNGKNGAELEQIARNICSTKGINIDEAFEQFKKMCNM